jgi:hypothetical protein
MREIEHNAIFKDDTDQEDFIERFSSLLQEMDADESAGIDLSSVIAAACRYLVIEEKELARRFYVKRSAKSRTTLKISRDPELSAATRTIQRKLKTTQH